jgi:Ner family transcriptional regulator
VKKNNQKPETLEEIISNPMMLREWIRFQLRIHGSSFTGLATELGVTRQAVTDVFRHRYPKMERAVAKKLGMAPEVLWPDRYRVKPAVGK